jgi:hypothetical protein
MTRQTLTGSYRKNNIAKFYFHIASALVACFILISESKFLLLRLTLAAFGILLAQFLCKEVGGSKS